MFLFFLEDGSPGVFDEVRVFCVSLIFIAKLVTSFQIGLVCVLGHQVGGHVAGQLVGEFRVSSDAGSGFSSGHGVDALHPV